MVSDTRGTIRVADALVLAHTAHAGGQQVLRVEAPRIARAALPGMFVHIRCAAAIAMRRPMSIMRADREDGWIEILYKVVGAGSRALAAQGPGARINMLGPIGRPFEAHRGRPAALLVGGGVGIPPMVFLADELRRAGGFEPCVMMGSEVPFPFELGRSAHAIGGLPVRVDACMAMMEDWGIPSCLASARGFDGCYRGMVTDMARAWLRARPAAARDAVALYACGPTPMLRAVADLAREFALPCQVALEEFMACGVGGCAGCVVRIRTPHGPAMRRVCVDGPVFDAREVMILQGGH